MWSRSSRIVPASALAVSVLFASLVANGPPTTDRAGDLPAAPAAPDTDVGDPVGALASDAIAALNSLGIGFAPPSASLAAADTLLASPGNVSLILQALDLDGDGALTFDEVVGAELLAVTRVVRPALLPQPPDDGAPVGGDEALTAIAQGFLTRLADFLQLGIANEVGLPAVGIGQMDGDPRALLAGVPLAALGTVQDVIADLDTRPFPAGDMADAQMTVNNERKGILMRDVARIFPHFEAGRFQVVRRQLDWLRARADVDQSPPGWIAGPAAERVVARIDRILALLAE